jgi:flagellar hook-associated protein 1 FlgK
MLGTLNVSQTGLNAARVAVENVSNNIANENTPGYKKRVVQVSEVAQIDSRFTGRGAQADSAYRITSQYMYDNILSENTKLGNYEKQSTTLGNIESIFKETDSSGFSADLDRYFQSIEDLRTNPQSEVSKTIFQKQGQTLVESLQNLYSGMEKQEIFEKDELENNVKRINNILNEIGTINEQIGQYQVASNDLLDKRDQLEKELSTYADIEVDRSNGEYQIKISGTTVVRFNVNVSKVEVAETNTVQVQKFLNEDATGSNVVFNAGLFNNDDVISFRLNNEFEVTVTANEGIDLDGDGTDDFFVDETNYIRALVHKINSNTDTQNSVVAYNGNYQTDANGVKTEVYPNQQNFLLIESRVEGTKGSFEGKLTLVEKDNPLDSSEITNKASFYQNEDYSKDATSRVFISINDKEVPINGGILKSQTENLTSDSPNNKIQNYKDKLDLFAKTLSDLTDKFVRTGTNEYLYGEDKADLTIGDIQSIGLFSGGDVKSLTFNSNVANNLNQNDLDYLATIQFKKDISFTGEAQNPGDNDVSSLSEFFQELRVDIASDKGSNDFLLETQGAVQQSLENAFNELTKVDGDEEMLNLIKFQAAYTANAKVITVIDEMLQTLLGIKR